MEKRDRSVLLSRLPLRMLCITLGIVDDGHAAKVM